MSKIIAKEVRPEWIDFRDYFDDDGLTNNSGKNCAAYIPGDRNSKGFNDDEYQTIRKQAESIIEGFNDVDEKYDGGYSSYKEVMKDYNIPYNPKTCHKLKEWAKTADTDNTDSIAEYLTITTGEEWATKAFCGYCQGDYCEVVYCTAHYSDEHIKEIGKFWLGCGTEFSIDDCYGFYVVDELRWEEGEKLTKYLAESYGCKPEELEIHLYDGEHTEADYRILER